MKIKEAKHKLRLIMMLLSSEEVFGE